MTFALPHSLATVTITEGRCPETLAGVVRQGVLWQAAPGRLLLNSPDGSRILLENGERIVIDTSQPATATSTLQHPIQPTLLATLAYQRGMLALHAAAATVGNRTIVIAGDSCCGKSALLLELFLRGWHMLSDELTIVEPLQGGGTRVCPMFPGIALWPDTLKHSDIQTDGLPQADANRLLFSANDRFAGDPRRLCEIYWLGIHSQHTVMKSRLEGSQRFRSIGNMLYNSHIADCMFEPAAYLQAAMEVVNSSVIFQLLRPRGKWSVQELADCIEAGV